MSQRHHHALDEVAPSLHNFVCWDPTRVADVMNTEALVATPEVFLATHHPMPMYRSDLTDERTGRPYDQEQFREDFLGTPDYAFVAVLGGAGTGKSHLIRWLHSRIPETANRQVLLIPRAGTSLRDILSMILSRVEGEKFDEYRRSLAQTSGNLTLAEARTKLLESLAMVVGSERYARAQDLSEMQQHLVEELPKFLNDVVIRDHFLQEGGLIDHLASQILGGATVVRVEQRREFTVADLPLQYEHIGSAARPARDFHAALNISGELQEATVQWMNGHVHEAITHLMRLSGTDLLRLMREVRTALAEQGVELVILIEDLATLQGIDHELLEALIARPQQSQMAPLCALRAAVAMTSGYYDGLRKNIRQRFDFRVLMDSGDTDTRGLMTALDVERFTARYFNATRLSAASLKSWLHDQEHEDTPHPVPSACDECPFREPCHAAFGAHDGMGLYPLNRAAVQGIAEAVSPAGFNPRTQLKDGYKPLLENYAVSLGAGTFPPREILQRFPRPVGIRLSSVVVQELKRRDPQNFERREALLSLWSHAQDARDLDPRIHEAFSLSPLGLSSEVEAPAPAPAPVGPGAKMEPGTTTTPGGGGVATTSVLSEAEARLETQTAEIDAWRAGEPLSQQVAQRLRELVFPAVAGHVDWDACHLLEGQFVGDARPFQQRRSITFHGQFLSSSERMAPQVQLKLPLRPDDNDDFLDTAIALQGLLRFDYHKSWQFEGGARYFRAFARQVDAWARDVLAQINRLTQTGESWDPVPAATQILLIGARLSGRLKRRDVDLAQCLDAVFQAPLPDDETRSSTWLRLHQKLSRYHAQLRDLVVGRVACSKGSDPRVQMVDAARLLPVISAIRRTWAPVEDVPSDLRPAYAFLAECQLGLRESLSQAVSEERDAQVNRFDAIASLLGAQAPDVDSVLAARTSTVNAVRDAVSAASQAGVLLGAQPDQLTEKLDRAAATPLKAWAEAVARIRDQKDTAVLIAELSASHSATAQALGDFLRDADAVVTKTMAAVEDDLRSRGEAGAKDLWEAQEEIERGLARLVVLAGEVAGALPATVPEHSSSDASSADTMPANSSTAEGR